MTNEKSIPYHILGLTRMLSHIERYNTRLRFNHESVAEHSFYVVYFTYLLCAQINLSCGVHRVDISHALIVALVHDFDEALSGDIASPFKKMFKEEYMALSKFSIDELMNDAPTPIKNNVISNWMEYENKTSTESYIVEMADILSGVIYSIHEVKLGNFDFIDILESYLTRLKGIGAKIAILIDCKLVTTELNLLYCTCRDLSTSYIRRLNNVDSMLRRPR